MHDTIEGVSPPGLPSEYNTPHMQSSSPIRTLSLAAAVALTAGVAVAQPDPSGIEFVTVGAPGNAPWMGGGRNNGRGAVDYEFRIGRFEVTTAQWAEFMNAAFDRPANDRIPFVAPPIVWGAQGTTPTTAGGLAWRVAAGREMIPVGGVDWRTSAIFCNWLHNGKSSERAAFLDGAYDVSTFGYLSDGGGILDQLTRHEGARFFIPSLDEWIKAAHYDPNRNGAGQGGYWLYSNSSDDPYVYAPPPSAGFNGTANANWNDFRFPGQNPYSIPLGAYADTRSPWGLLDVAGGTSEWTEGYFQIPGEPVPRERYFEGTGWDFVTTGVPDTPGTAGGATFPSFGLPRVGRRLRRQYSSQCGL
mgnify:CR=1 FL=1